ncbi:MAG: tetraacyldisaccharide 4'-kinase [Bythopirellula sp.]|nr:tetraacyldisaccharide 4'-kinase [Bythopirellula sp.]
MLSPSEFRDLVSGRRTGVKAVALRTALRIAEVPYALAMRYRNRRYARGKAKIHDAGVPVVSVGNLTLGGTGKTPLVEWLAHKLRESQIRVAIVSRGYGARAGGYNDEALELELALPGVPHVQDPDRVAAARVAAEELQMQLILLDDGFQHRRLKRDLDIVLLDATEPFGFDHVFPRGTLREPLAGLARADVIVLSRADMLDSSEREKIHARVTKFAPQAGWCEVEHRVAALLNSAGQHVDLSVLADKRVAAFCGIGNPAGFRYTLATLGCEIIAWREFPDHHNYTRADVASLSEWGQNADAIVCTRKDLVKLRVPTLGGVALWAVEVEIGFVKGQSAIENELQKIITNVDAD